MRGEVFDVQKPQVGCASDRIQNRFWCNQAAAGEDVPLNKVDRFQILRVALLRHRDSLNEHLTFGFQQAAALREKRVEVFVADGLDHLDRNQFVELALEIAIVFQQQSDSIGQPFFRDTSTRKVVLL